MVKRFLHFGIPVILILLGNCSVSSAKQFSPALLKLKSNQIILYNFDGKPLEIPFTVEGTPAGVIFSVYSRGKGDRILPDTKGYLGWHYMNGVDTCIYCSQMYPCEPGDNKIYWDGRNQDGNIVKMMDYTFYLWGFDNISEKQLVSGFMNADWAFDRSTTILAVDGNGMARANPLLYRADSYWTIGNDPLDETLKCTTDISHMLAPGWEILGDPLFDPTDHNNRYIMVADRNNRLGSIQRYRFIPSEASVIDTLWSHGGFADTFETAGGGSAGVTTDGTYLFTTDDNHNSSSTPDADFYIYDFDGHMVDYIDLTPWWSSPEAYDAGGQMNGGPNSFTARDDYVFLGCQCNCLVQMVNPKRYLESEKYENFFAWSNGNGDYVLDKNFEETANLPWVCNDYNAGVFRHSISADDNLFSMTATYDVGAVSFGLLGPDGTGIGYFAFAGETSYSDKNGLMVVDDGTPFDGIYSNNSVYFQSPEKSADYKTVGIGYTAHDSIKGMIASTGDCLDYDAVITLVFPNGGESLRMGSAYDITWSITGRCDMPEYLRIEQSFDGGKTWSAATEMTKTIDKVFTWKTPDIVSPDCRIRLRDAQSGSLLYVCDAPFSIVREVAVEEAGPHTFSLAQNIPNPFNPRTSVAFSLPVESRVTLTVYMVTGTKAATLVDSVLPAGTHEAVWDASDFPSGVYLCRLVAGGRSKTVKMTLVK